MQLTVLEPLGLPGETVEQISSQYLPPELAFTYWQQRAQTDEELLRRAKDAEILVIANQPLPREVLAACPKLQMLAVAFTGLDHIPLADCRSRGIVVRNSAGYATDAVTELTFGLLFGLLRYLPQADDATRQGLDKTGLIGGEIAGKSFGVIGTGAIGSRVAGVAQAFGCRVYAYARHPKALPGVTFLPLEELLQTCDIVSLHVPLTPETRHLLDGDKLALLKKEAVLLNTARGPVVDEAALAAALNRGDLAGAAVDVFATEPPLPPDAPLLHAKNVLLAPHVGFATREAMVKRAHIVFAAVAEWLAQQ